MQCPQMLGAEDTRFTLDHIDKKPNMHGAPTAMFADIGPTQNTNLVEVENAEIQPCLWDRPDERREHLQQQERIR